MVLGCALRLDYVFSTVNGKYRIYYNVITYYCLSCNEADQIAYNCIVLKSLLMPVAGSCQQLIRYLSFLLASHVKVLITD